MILCQILRITELHIDANVNVKLDPLHLAS